MIRQGELNVGDMIQWRSEGLKYRVVRVNSEHFYISSLGREYRYTCTWRDGVFKNASIVKKAKETEVKVRAADDWRVGDMAYCRESGGSISEGDILKVTATAGGYIKFGPGRPGAFTGAGRFARVLTPKEIEHLPEGSTVVAARTGPGFGVGSRFDIGKNFCSNNKNYDQSLAYALLSLPKPSGLKVRDLKEGDWIRFRAECTPHHKGPLQVEEVRAGGDPRHRHIKARAADSGKLVTCSEGETNYLATMKLCDPPEGWDQQEAITEARNEIHEAEAMLKRAKAKLDGLKA